MVCGVRMRPRLHITGPQAAGEPERSRRLPRRPPQPPALPRPPPAPQHYAEGRVVTSAAAPSLFTSPMGGSQTGICSYYNLHHRPDHMPSHHSPDPMLFPHCLKDVPFHHMLSPTTCSLFRFAALHMAAANGHTDIITILLQAGAVRNPPSGELLVGTSLYSTPLV